MFEAQISASANTGHADWLRPSGLPAHVGALMSTRAGGVSQGAFAGLNLRPPELPGSELDEPAAVLANRERFALALEGAQPHYLSQVHGCELVRLTAEHSQTPATGQLLPEADASITTERQLACTVLVADCLPVLFWLADPSATQAVGAAHAGWRGLAGGVLEATLAALCAASQTQPAQVHAWLGACIGPQRFEVGADVREAFADGPKTCFVPGAVPGKWWANLPELARWRLQRAGVEHISGGTWCTASDASRFFSFRRDRVTGRHAAAIWLR